MSRRKKANKRRYDNTIDLEEYRKSYVTLKPRNKNQDIYISLLQDPNINIVFAHGPAGTGKTILAVMQAIKAYKEHQVEKIIITRPAVGTDGEKHGFLPGDINSKMQPWVRPIMDVFTEYYSPRIIQRMIRDEFIELSPLAYMRGRTFKNAFIVADECQNTTCSQMKMLLTRIGEGSKMVVTGDLDQHDKQYDKNGLKDFLNRLLENDSEYIADIKFEHSDIERHPAVADVLNIYKT